MFGRFWNWAVWRNKEKINTAIKIKAQAETHAKTVFAALETTVDGVLEAVDILRLRLAERRDCDSARSRERKERNSDSSRCGWRVK